MTAEQFARYQRGENLDTILPKNKSKEAIYEKDSEYNPNDSTREFRQIDLRKCKAE